MVTQSLWSEAQRVSSRCHAASPRSVFNSGVGNACLNHVRSSSVISRPKVSLKLSWNWSNDICGWPLIVINI